MHDSDSGARPQPNRSDNRSSNDQNAVPGKHSNAHPGDVRPPPDPTGVVRPPAVNAALSRERPPIPDALARNLNIILGHDGHAYAISAELPNGSAARVGSKLCNAIIRGEYAKRGTRLRPAELAEINEMLVGHAEHCGIVRPVWNRVAPVPGGVEIDLGDDTHTRVRITAEKVEIIPAGSDTLFYRTPITRAMALPAPVGNLDLLRPYLNVHPRSIPLLIAWLTYTLAHPKIATTKFVILVLQGPQGSGKTSLCRNVIQRLIDPTSLGVQVLPRKATDFAIAAQNSHVAAFDNVRGFNAEMSDLMCIAATGGVIASRRLYTNDDQHVLSLHAALVVNGIHSFVSQADLAQRSLPIELLPIEEAKRQSEAELLRAFEADLPAIQRGLFDLMAAILQHRPTATVTNPQRMYDFVEWLAAMEAAERMPLPIYQLEYAEVLKQGQLDTLLDHVLGSAVVEFAARMDAADWSGTPAELHRELCDSAPPGTLRSREWPANPIALSKRLRSLQASLRTQGIGVELIRGKHRIVAIRKLEASDE